MGRILGKYLFVGEAAFLWIILLFFVCSYHI